MTATITPTGAFCAVDPCGLLRGDYCRFHHHEVAALIPKEVGWRVVPVVIDPQTSWAERDEAARAVSELPDAVACAMLGGQRDEWADDVP